MTLNSRVTADAPIIVLDSGLGGLTVARALRATLPAEDILYFADTARLPYGSKSPQAVTDFVRQIVQYLLPHQPKHIVFACNTATALALPQLRGEFPELSISGVLEPGARAAVAAAGRLDKPRIGVIATEGTIASRAYERSILRCRTSAQVFQLATPLLVAMIEEGRDDDDPLVTLALQQYLAPMLERQIDVLLLGCTHYPVLMRAIATAAGRGVSVIDSANACAQDVNRRLKSDGLLRSGGAQGKFCCMVTDYPHRFALQASKLMGFEILQTLYVAPDALYAPQPLLRAS